MQFRDNRLPLPSGSFMKSEGERERRKKRKKERKKEGGRKKERK